MHVFTILSSRAILALLYFQATLRATFTPSIAIMSAVWEKPGQVPPVLCTRQSTRVPILMPYVTRPRIYTCTVVARLMPAFKHRMVSQNWAWRPLLHCLHAAYCWISLVTGG